MNPPVIHIALGIELDGVALASTLSAELPMRLQRAALEAANYAKIAWQLTANALGAHDRGGYIGGIEAATITVESEREASDQDGCAYYEVVVLLRNTAPHAAVVEDGHSAFHLPSRINWSRTDGRIKRGPGGPHLHIPFTHTAPTSPGGGATKHAARRQLPPEVYGEAKKLRRRLRTNQGPIRSSTGQFMAADRYKWGPGSGKAKRMERGHVSTGLRVSSSGVAVEERRSARQVGRTPGRRADGGGKPRVNPEWGSSRYEGLFKSGPPRHTQYMTVRTITPNSAGWHIPARAGLGIVRAVASELAHDDVMKEIVHDAILGGLTG